MERGYCTRLHCIYNCSLEKIQGKTHEGTGENTGNFDLIRVWQPCINLIKKKSHSDLWVHCILFAFFANKTTIQSFVVNPILLDLAILCRLVS